MKFIKDLTEGERINEIYLCRKKQSALTKAGKPYESLMLQDKTGTLDAKIWEPSSMGIDDYDELDYIWVQGDITSFQGAYQLNIKRLRVAQEGEYIPADYLPCSDKDVDVMYEELLGFVRSVDNPYIKQLLEAFFVEDEAFIKKFKNTSAAKTVHHGFMGGLLEHSLSVTRLCAKMSENYDFLNRDLLISCAMLHDVGKVRELSEFPRNDYTDEGNFIGHIVIGYEMVIEKIRHIPDFPEILANEVGHCILSHHGELEYGSPKKPAIAEAIALSMADNMDAKLETLRECLEAKDTNDWLGFNRWLESNIRRTSC